MTQLLPTTFFMSALGLFLLATPSHPQTATPLPNIAGAIPAQSPPFLRVQSDQRDLVIEVQRHLQTLGLYSSAIDGIAGPGTWGAIQQFYGLAGIRADGFGGEQFVVLERAANLYTLDGMNRAEAIYHARDPRLAAAAASQQQAEMAYRDGQHEEAERLIRMALLAFDRLLGKEHPQTLIVRGTLAEALHTHGRYSDAEVVYRKFYEAASVAFGVEHPITLGIRNNLAAAIASQGRYSEAEALHRETLATQERLLGTEHPETIQSRVNLAVAIEEQGRLAEAEELNRQTLTFAERLFGPEHPDTLIIRSNLANAITAQGRHPEAEALYREILGISERVLGREQPDTLLRRNNLASTIEIQGRHADAETLYRKTLNISERVLGEAHRTTLYSRGGLANSLRSQGRLAEAESLDRGLLVILEKSLGVEHPDSLNARMNVAIAANAQGRHAEAEVLYREALTVWERTLGTEHPKTLSAINNLANALGAQGRHGEAETFYRETLTLREGVLGREHPQTLGTRNNLAVAIYAQGRHDEALRVIEAGLAHLPVAFAATGQIPFEFDVYLAAAWVETDIPELPARTLPMQGYLTYGELDVALGDMAARQQVGDAATAAALREFQEAREELQRLRRAYLVSFEPESGVSEEARARVQSDMRAADERFSEIAALIDRDFPALAELELPRALSADEAQALLEPGEGLLAYASLDDHLYAWLVTQDSITWHRMDAPRADLADRVAHLRASLDLNADAPPLPPAPGCGLQASDPWMEDRPFDLCAARELHEIVLGEIDLSGIEELIVVPNGPLETLPFAMLVTDHTPGANPRWLIEDHAIATLPTTSSLRALRQGGGSAGRDDRLPFLGIAPVEFDATSPDSALRGTPLAALPGTADEVRLLSGLLGAGRDGTVIGSGASEAFVKSAPLERYRVLSFATHGLLSREAAEVTEGAIREMALALRPGAGEDGFLTASEVAGLRLDADWVLLSACNTAGGDGDDAQGLSGLARAFFFAGARALMVSHWLIDDAVTPQLMADTMERSGTGDGVSRAQALRQAQLAMLSQRDHAHPFYWAPFSVVGENR